MEKEFIPYEQALALKELGFDEPCFRYYKPNGELDYIENHILKDFPYLAKNSEWQDLVAAPTFSQAFRWFRDNYGILSSIQYCRLPNIFWFKIDDAIFTNVDFETYEEAELACLEKLIEIVKEKE
jgi:hypothetical protein